MLCVGTILTLIVITLAIGLCSCNLYCPSSVKKKKYFLQPLPTITNKTLTPYSSQKVVGIQKQQGQEIASLPLSGYEQRKKTGKMYVPLLKTFLIFNNLTYFGIEETSFGIPKTSLVLQVLVHCQVSSIVKPIASPPTWVHGE